MSGYLFPGSFLVIALLASWYYRRKSLTGSKPQIQGNNRLCGSDHDGSEMTMSGSIEGGVAHDDGLQNPNEAWLQTSSDITCEIDDSHMSSLVFLADGKLVATSSLAAINHKTRIWVAENDRLEMMEPTIEHDKGAAIASIAASKDGKYIISGGKRGKVTIWEDTKTDPIRKLGELYAANGSITALDVSPDSLRVASGSDDGQVVIWCLLTRKILVGPLRKGSSSPVSSVKFSPRGDRLASAHIVGSEKTSVGIWHGHTGAQLGSAPIAWPTYSLAWSIDGRRLFTGGSRGTIKCFDTTTQSVLSRWQAHFKDHITTLAVTHNGQFLVSASSGWAFGVHIWDIWDLSPSTPIRSCNGAHLFSISPDNTRLATIEEKSKLCLRSLSCVKFSLCRRLSPLVKEREHFTYISNSVHDTWESGDLERAEQMLSKEIEENAPEGLMRYQHANRALVRVRLKDWDGALKDVMRCDGPAPLIVYVAKGLVYYGKPGTGMEMDPFDSALHYCNDDMKHFVQSIKSIAILDSPRFDVKVETPIDSPDNINRLVRARERFLRARHYMGREEDFEKAKELLDGIPNLNPLLQIPEARTISLMFDWDLGSLIPDIHELRCRILYKMESSHLPVELNYFSAGEKDVSEELEAVTTKLSLLSEGFGDKASSHGRNDQAVAWYTEALALTGCPSGVLTSGLSMAEVLGKDQATLQRLRSLRRCPGCIAHLLASRSEVEARNRSWEDALADAEWAIQVDSSHIPGHRAKCKALHELKNYKEACAALKEMSSKIKQSEMDDLNRRYLGTVSEVDKIMEEVLDKYPFILIHVEDGTLCDRDKQKDKFKKDSAFYELVSSISQNTAPQMGKVEEVVKTYFRYVMLSHTWEKEEPLFHDISDKSVYSPLITEKYEKLSKFCKTVRDDYKPYQWSWNDTCCIDKKGTDRQKLEKSIKSMYNWYHNSALTLILLANPSNNPDPKYKDSDLLEHNRWIFRAWTLQELLAPKVIRFYHRTWKLYHGDSNVDHKTSPDIISELARATGVDEAILASFSLERLSVREKLRLASNRQAKERVDIAYSLIGIFKSDIRVDYTHPDAEVPLGMLLQEIIHRQKDTSVLDWIGEPSRFNSALPANISVYDQGPYELPDIVHNEVDKRLSRTLATEFYDTLTKSMGSLSFQERHLKLPCIAISVTDVTPVSVNADGSCVYVASTEALGTFDFSTKDAPSSWQQERVVLVYPWIRQLVQKIEPRGGDEYTKALRAIAYLANGFRALLFAKPLQSRHAVGYRRIAAEMQINIRAHELDCWKGIAVESLEIWDH